MSNMIGESGLRVRKKGGEQLKGFHEGNTEVVYVRDILTLVHMNDLEWPI